ncbi:ABC transporter ATP-binding protein [Virgisporangium aurantiacum]|uniref:ABC transporter ATP-binding protein n=1 Tax=Virgisporangium aurantiacum TaxID=175570 RepID=A0A8J4E5V7_9ACTN|nr:ABC transporter ATP-binding protein [Virgisporangium aurantiacum]GIJ62741.1 ABC transporter ATP-binding protein [Virgisporangium aurantiacum]
MPLLSVQNLSVTYTPRDHPAVRAVHDVSFTVDDDEFVGLLGESGCGKSTLGNAILRLLAPPARISGGTVEFGGRDITKLAQDELREMRWVDLSTVFQSSMNSLNPVIRVEDQFADTFDAHRDAPKTDPAELLRMVSLDPEVLKAFPHELSGGMKQRVALALALALRPKLVLLDEPTTGLDVVVQRSILNELRTLREQLGFAVIFISHDLGTVLELADRVMVMYGGELVENRPAAEMLRDPRHPYTRGLLGSYADPRLAEVNVTYIPGRPPDLSREHRGCLFTPRCPYAEDQCRETHPELLENHGGLVRCHVAQQERLPAARKGGFSTVDTAAVAVVEPVADAPVLAVENVSKTYRTRRGLRTSTTEAVIDVSLKLFAGRVTALVGQSGSGKSTIARLVTGVERPTEGTVTFGETRVDRLRGRALRDYRRHVQMVFQDPFSALNPTRTVAYALSRPLVNYRGLRGRAVRDRAAELLESVGLSPAAQFLDKLPHQLSGGQRQRVVTARALAPEPEILIADEPISMLDVSIRAEILELLGELARSRGLAMLYITHDLLSARLLADDVLVLNKGQLVESGPTLEVIRSAKDDYTRLLLDSIPNPFAKTA